MADFFTVNPTQEIHLQASEGQRKRLYVSANGPVLVRDPDGDSSSLSAGDSVVLGHPVWIKPEDFHHGFASLIVFTEGEGDYIGEEPAEGERT
jgi:hypothetical protein